MHISRIDVYQAHYGLQDSTYAWSGGHSVAGFTTTVVKLSTDEGLSGFGEVCPLGSGYMEAHAGGVPEGIRALGPALLGQDPTRLRAINAVMDASLGGHHYVKSPIDIACWDILGQSAGLPVATLLGGRLVDDYPLYRAISQDVSGSDGRGRVRSTASKGTVVSSSRSAPIRTRTFGASGGARRRAAR